MKSIPLNQYVCVDILVRLITELTPPQVRKLKIKCKPERAGSFSSKKIH